jgi:hypothetical protein
MAEIAENETETENAILIAQTEISCLDESSGSNSKRLAIRNDETTSTTSKRQVNSKRQVILIRINSRSNYSTVLQ